MKRSSNEYPRHYSWDPGKYIPTTYPEVCKSILNIAYSLSVCFANRAMGAEEIFLSCSNLTLGQYKILILSRGLTGAAGCIAALAILVIIIGLFH